MLVRQTIHGITESVESMQLIQARMEDQRPVFTLLQAEFYNIEEDLFASEGQTGRHGPWDDISDETRARRQRRNNSGDGKILHDTGALEASLTRPNQRGSRRVITRHMMNIGSALPQASYAEHTNRRPIDFTVSQEDYFILQIQRYVMGEIL